MKRLALVLLAASCGGRLTTDGDAGVCSADPLHAIHWVGFDPSTMGDLERGVQPGAGEGEHFYAMPVSGKLVSIELVAWVTAGTQSVIVDVNGSCSSTSITVPPSAFPVRDRDPRRATTVMLPNPLVAPAGTPIEVVVHPVGGTLILSVRMEDTDGSGEMIFPDGTNVAGAPRGWDAILRIQLN